MKVKMEKIRKNQIRKLLLIGLIYVVAVLAIFCAAVYNEINTTMKDMQTAVNAVSESYRQNSAAESRIEASYIRMFQSEVSVISRILSDYDIQNFDDEDRLGAVDSLKELRNRSSSRELYVCDAQGRLFLASGEEWIDASLVEKGFFTREQLTQLTEKASESNPTDDADVQSIPVELSDGYGYCFCRQILDSADMPTDYYLIMVYDVESVNEGIDTWLDKTVLARAVSTKDPMMGFFVLEEEEMIFSNREGNWIQAEFTPRRSREASDGTQVTWGNLKLTDEAGKKLSYSIACQETVQRENGKTYRIIAVSDYTILASGLEYRFGGAAGSTTVLLALLLLFVIYCIYAWRVLGSRREFMLISSGVCVVALFLFGVMASYFQSLEDLTEVTVTADQVSGQIRELKENQKKRSSTLAEDYMNADMTKLGLVAFDVEYSGQKIMEADSAVTYHQTDGTGSTQVRKDSLGNSLICYAGAEILKNKNGIFNGADIWLINDSGFAVAASNPENWSFNINDKDYAQDARKVMYGETGSISVYYSEEDAKEKEDSVGSLIIYPVDLYVYTDKNGSTAYTNRREYEKMLLKQDGVPADIQVQMGILLVRSYELPEAYSMTQESFQNNLSTIVTASGCSYARMGYDTAEGKCLELKEQILEKGASLELEQISVPEGIQNSTVFNYFQKISKQSCFVRVTKEVSEGEAEAIVFRNEVVHRQRNSLLGAYLLAAGLAFGLTYLILLQEAKKIYGQKPEVSGIEPEENRKNAGKILSTKLRTFVNDRNDDENQKGRTRVVRLLLYLVVLLAAGSVVGDLFLSEYDKGVGVFVNIYSTDWERCVNAYNIGAVIAMLVVAAIAFGFVKLLINMFCVPLGRKVETYARLLVSVIQYALIFCGIFYGAYLLGMELKSIGTFATVIAGVIGIGSQQLISDVGSGVAMLGEGRYMIGDLVQVDGFTGVIREMGIRNCILVNEELIEKSVSNGKMNNAALLKKNVPIPSLQKMPEQEETEKETTEKETTGKEKNTGKKENAGKENSR